MEVDQSLAKEKGFVTRLSFVCTGQGNKISPVNVSISPVPSTVSDLKLEIQSRFKIPKCLQTICLDSGHSSLSDLQLLKDLYIRSGDSFTVTYLDTAEVDVIGQFAQCLATFVRNLADFCEKHGDVTSYQSTSESDKQLFNRFAIIAHVNKFLSPWNGLSTIEANRQFLIQENVIDNTLKLYSILLETPLAKLSTDLSNLEVNCMGLLWNFAETREARLYVVNRGGFTLMLRTLDYWTLPPVVGVGYDMYGLFDHCVGCVSNYSEIEQCQIPLATNSPGLNALLSFGVDGPSLNVYTKLLIANCLFRLSHNVNTHRFLAQTDILEKTLQFFSKFEANLTYTTNMVIGYALTVTFSRLLSFSLKLVPSHLVGRIILALNTFLTSVQKERMTKALEDCQCNWITLAPFIDIFFAPIHFSRDKPRVADIDTNADQGTELKAEISSDLTVARVCMNTSVMSLAVEMARSCHRRLAVKQGLLDCLVCLPWVVEDQWHDEVCAVVKFFKRVPAPTLHSLAAVTLAKIGGFSIRDTFKF